MLPGQVCDIFHILTLDDHFYQHEFVIAEEKPVPMRFVVRTGSPLVSKRDLTIADIINTAFILTEKDMGYRRELDRELAKRSLQITPVLEVGRTDIITTLLEQTNSISYLPAFTAEKKVREGKLAYLDVTDFQASTWKQLIYHKNKWISDSMKAFLDFVKKHEFGQTLQPFSAT